MAQNGHGAKPIEEYPSHFWAWTKYRRNGHRVIWSDRGKNGVYEKPELVKAELRRAKTRRVEWAHTHRLGVEDPECGSDAHASRYTFTYDGNFLNGSTPYRNQGHHLVPDGVFISLFPTKEREILKQVEYDVDNGENIIFLPVLERDCAFHDLPYHNGDHKKYSKQVKSDAKALSRELRNYVADGCEEGTDVPGSVATKLKRLEVDYWGIVSKAGRVAVNSIRLSESDGALG